MSIPSPISIGWPQIVKDYTVIQGNYGVVNLTIKALRQDGTAYPSYEGFTGKFTLYTLGGKVILTLPTENVIIQPLPLTQEIKVSLIFNSSVTLLFPPDSDLIGDLLISPDGIEKQYPFRMKLRVTRSFTR